jgi:manganese efflux pump family protein
MNDISAMLPEYSDLVTILLIALGLSADCFAVALSASLSKTKHTRIEVLRTALSFGFFQTAMPVLGWLAGRSIITIISNYDHWIAFVLLAFIGGKMIWESITEKEEKERNISHGWTLVTLSFATSIDALAVGLSFAFLEVNIWFAAVFIGIIAFLSTVLAFLVGMKVSGVLGKRAELIGGLVLIGIGLKIIIEHLLD